MLNSIFKRKNRSPRKSHIDGKEALRIQMFLPGVDYQCRMAPWFVIPDGPVPAGPSQPGSAVQSEIDDYAYEVEDVDLGQGDVRAPTEEEEVLFTSLEKQLGSNFYVEVIASGVLKLHVYDIELVQVSSYDIYSVLNGVTLGNGDGTAFANLTALLQYLSGPLGRALLCTNLVLPSTFAGEGSNRRNTESCVGQARQAKVKMRQRCETGGTESAVVRMLSGTNKLVPPDVKVHGEYIEVENDESELNLSYQDNTDDGVLDLCGGSPGEFYVYVPEAKMGDNHIASLAFVAEDLEICTAQVFEGEDGIHLQVLTCCVQSKLTVLSRAILTTLRALRIL